MDKETEYRNALLWAFDRLSIDRITPREIRYTMIELGNVIQGKPSPASRYTPREHEANRKMRARCARENHDAR